MERENSATLAERRERVTTNDRQRFQTGLQDEWDACSAFFQPLEKYHAKVSSLGKREISAALAEGFGR